MSYLAFKSTAWRLPLLLVGSVLLLGGCRFTDGNTKIQYMPDMADSPTFKPQETFLEPPEHSIPINGVLYPDTIEQAEKELKNPYPPSEQIIAEGKVAYENFCVACHGVGGKGDNALGPRFPKVTDISTAAYKDRNDAFIFYRITFGAASMPSYGDKISAHERWKIVHYLRTLQN